MTNTAYILFVIVSISASSWYQPSDCMDIGPQCSVVDTWATSSWQGDTITPGQGHYKAIFFADKKGLLEYLSEHRCDNGYLLDCGKCQWLTIKQVECKRTRVDTTKVFDHYQVQLEAEK
jgi:hypothetical protein